MHTRTWLVVAGMVPFLAGTGCTQEQVAKTTATENTEPRALSAESQPSLSPQPPVPGTEAKTGLVVDGRFVQNENIQPVYFDLSTSHLDEKAKAVLTKNDEWLKQNTPFMIEVAGFTDTRGSAKKNHWLAERRAAQVRDYYVSLGIPRNRIVITGLGQEQPACAPATEECLSQSRRCETLIENKTTALR